MLGAKQQFRSYYCGPAAEDEKRCGTHYPPDPEFRVCKVCVAECSEHPARPNTTAAKARAAFKCAIEKRRKEFKAYCVKRDEHRRRLGRPEPEEIGAMQARQEAKMLRELERAFSGR